MKKKISPFLKVCIWVVVIIIMMIVSFIIDNNENHWLDEFNQQETTEVPDNQVEEKITTYPNMQDILCNNNYDFVFTIRNENKYVYTGRRCNGLEEGFKEDKKGIIKYIIDIDNKAYMISNDEYNEIDNIYEGFDNNFLNFGKLFKNLNDILYDEEKTSDGMKYIYEKDGYQVEVYTNKDYINKINIVNGDTTYELVFSNMGKCNPIVFNN